MKKLLPLLCALFVCNIALWAAPVDEATARRIAAEFAAGTPSLRAGQATAAAPLTTAYVAAQPDGEAAYYVFNRGRSGGFVIVAGDDRAEAVLGYADRGTFHIDSIPPAMRWWLGEYAREMEAWTGTAAAVRTHRHVNTLTPMLPPGVYPLHNPPVPTVGEYVLPMQSPKTLQQATPQAALRTAEGAIAPLLGDIQWNQMEPYNNLCPRLALSGDQIIATATGCGATAMAQIMGYHRHPDRGTGQHSYLWESTQRELSADFSTTRYDWDNMIGNYEQTDYTPVQAEAVATLMYHVGISINMQYGPESSSYATDVPLALHSYFGYDGGMTLRSRDFYPADEWEALVLDELQQNRPVFYSGQAEGGGHAFVCDGYDGEGYFHINWGWGGYCDGHFLLNALNPDGQGTGGYEGGYNRAQQMVTGIQPDAGGQVTSAEMYSHGMTLLDTEVEKGGLFRINTGLYNYGWNTIRVNPGLLVYDAEGSLVKTLSMNNQPIELAPGYGWAFEETPYMEYFPADLTDGTYTLRFGYCTDLQPEWQPMPTLQTAPVAVEATVEGNTVRLAPVTTGEEPEPGVAELMLIPGESNISFGVEPDRDYAQELMVQNTGTADYSGYVYIMLYDETVSQQLDFYYTATPVTIAQGEKQSVQVNMNVGDREPGRYVIAFAYDQGENAQIMPIEGSSGTAFYFDIIEPQTQPQLTAVLDESDFPSAINQHEDFTVSTLIRNTGRADFVGDIYLLYYDASGGYIGYAPQTSFCRVAAGSETRVNIGDNIGERLTPGRYHIGVGYVENGQQNLYQMLFDNGTSAIPVEVRYREAPRLSRIAAETEAPATVQQNTDFTLSTVLTNSGGDFSGEVVALVTKGNYIQCESPRQTVSLTRGERKPVSFTLNVGDLEPGEYTLTISYLVGNLYMSVSSDDGIGRLPLQVEGTYTGPVLSVVYAESEIPTEFEQHKDYSVKASIRNEGLPYAGDIYLCLINAESQVVVDRIIPVDLSQGEQTTIHYDYWNVGDLATGEYELGFGYINGEYLSLIDIRTPDGGVYYRLPAAVIAGTTVGLDTPDTTDGLLLYPNPAGDHVTVCSDEGVQRLRLYSLEGTLQRDENARGASEHRLDLHGLPAGTYLLSVETPAGIRTERVMKR